MKITKKINIYKSQKDWIVNLIGPPEKIFGDYDSDKQIF